MFSQLPFEFIPALVGVCGYVLYSLLQVPKPLPSKKKKLEDPSEVASEPESLNSGAGEFEPDQEPLPAPEDEKVKAPNPPRAARACCLAPLACIGAAAVALIFAELSFEKGVPKLDQQSAPAVADLACNASGLQEPLLSSIARPPAAEDEEESRELATVTLPDLAPEAFEPVEERAEGFSSEQDGGNPLTVKLTRQSVTEDEEEDFVRSAYYGTLMVGSPPEPFTVVFDTGSGHLVLPSTYCKSDTCRVHKRYRRSASSTGHDINHNGKQVAQGQLRDQITVSFGTGEVTGVFVEDVVCIDGAGEGIEEALSDGAELALPKGCLTLRMIAATELSEEPFKAFQFDGILGLGLDGLSQTPEFNFLNVVAQSVRRWGGSHPQTFAVFLAESDGETSEIALGGWSPKHLREDLSWSPVHEPEMGHWLVNIKNIRVGNEIVNFCTDGTCKAAVDTGTSLLAVPSESFPEMYELLKHPTSLSGHCQGTGPLLHIELDSYTVTLGSRDYSRAEKTGLGKAKQRLPKVGKEGGGAASALASPTAVRRDLRCNPTFMTLDLPEPLGPKLFILGEPVLRKYYTAYDAQSKQVGFARARHVNAPSRDALLVMAVDEGIHARAPNMFDVFRWRKAYRYQR